MSDRHCHGNIEAEEAMVLAANAGMALGSQTGQ
jgi:hypothetical protein